MSVTKEDFRSDRVAGCMCDHIVCICRTKKNHKRTCKFRRAVQCPVGIACDHGFDVCPECDPCTCESESQKGSK